MMFSIRRNQPVISTPNSFSSSSSSSSPSSASPLSDNAYAPTNRQASPVVLRQLSVRSLRGTNSRSRYQHYSPSRQRRDSFQIPRPSITAMPSPEIREPNIDDPIWVPSRRRMYLPEPSTLPNTTIGMNYPEHPFYQIIPPPMVPPSPIQYQIVPIHSLRSSPIVNRRPIKRKKKYLQEKNPGLYTTLCSGGCGTIAALLYLSCCLALPITKLTLGIKYRNDCPVDNKIPLYMIVSGACGLGIILFLLISSACSYYRSFIVARKSTHTFMICSIALTRGIQGVIALFLFIWFFVGNFWVFSARYRVQTNNQNSSNNNYCHPVLYWFAFYALIFTYVYAIFMCFMKFVTNFFCCRSFDIWKRAFT